jgi:signal transduction histidine kinase
MRISTRLILASGATIVLVMLAAGWLAQRQRDTLLIDAHLRETETLARTLSLVVANAYRDGRLADVDALLESLAHDPATAAAVLLDERGAIRAGGPAGAADCLQAIDLARAQGTPGERSGIAQCGGRVDWVALAAGAPGETLLLARSITFVEREAAAARWRLLLTTLVLASAATGVILLVLHRTLTLPLAQIVRATESVGRTPPPPPVRLPRSAGELHALADAFNRMAERLEEKRQYLIRQAEEQIALERRLRQSEKFAALGRVTGGIAHELGSPLSAIVFRAEELMERPADHEAVREHADGIVAEVDRISDLVRGLFHIARRDPIEPHPVDLLDTVRQAAGEAALPAARAEIALEVRVPAEGVVVEGDAVLLRHALRNLLQNAVQALATHPGERRVDVRLDTETSVARVRVEDTGPGIPEADLARIFEPFFTTKDVGEGTGLGLAVSLGIVEEHGGRLHLAPRAGGGVVAEITLPLARRQQPARTKEAA